MKHTRKTYKTFSNASRALTHYLQNLYLENPGGATGTIYQPGIASGYYKFPDGNIISILVIDNKWYENDFRWSHEDLINMKKMREEIDKLVARDQE